MGAVYDDMPREYIEQIERVDAALREFELWQVALKVRSEIDEKRCDKCNKGYTTVVNGWNVWYCGCYDETSDNAFYFK